MTNDITIDGGNEEEHHDGLEGGMKNRLKNLLAFIGVAVLLFGNFFLAMQYLDGHKWVVYVRIAEPILLLLLPLTIKIIQRIRENTLKQNLISWGIFLFAIVGMVLWIHYDIGFPESIRIGNILRGIMIFGLLMVVIIYTIRKRKHISNKELINQYYSDEDMVKLLGLDKVNFPVIGLTKGDTPIPIRSLKAYKEACLYEPMLFGYDFDALLDKKGKRFRLEKISFQQIEKVVESLKDIPVRRAVEEASEPLEVIKERMLNEIKQGESPYAEYEEEIEQAKDIEELTIIMDKVES